MARTEVPRYDCLLGEASLARISWGGIISVKGGGRPPHSTTIVLVIITKNQSGLPIE